nr:B12-binding domain-containing radical SAM protein [Eubacterium sp.]
MKKILLTAINAKYIHSNLAVYSLRANAGKYAQKIELAEYTINHHREEILQGIYQRRPDVVGFSCYIWNIEYVLDVAENLKKVLPEVHIVLGGPEVSYDAKERLDQCPFVDAIVVGEGEETFREFVEMVVQDGDWSSLVKVPGLCLRVDGVPTMTEARAPMDMDQLVFPYGDLQDMENRIIYYETMRGCPFSCSYCLSSVDKQVRMRSLEKVFGELAFFIENKVKQVKFVDRTFNCNHDHAYRIWEFLHQHDNGITNFHFEIAGDLLREEDFELLEKFRPGLVQFEIGVQSTNPKTLEAIRRKMDLSVLEARTERVRKMGNIHQHLDLIAGLPHEDLSSFRNSFNDVYAMKPDQLQLGFLKVLTGSYMNEMTEEYEIQYGSRPPYEVLTTKWLTFADVLLLKGVEEMVEVHYNSFQFVATVALLEKYHDNAFALYESLADFYELKGYLERKHSRVSRYEILWEYVMEKLPEIAEVARQTLTYDLYSRDYVKNPPAFVKQRDKEYLSQVRQFLDGEVENPQMLQGYEGFVTKQLFNMVYVGQFTIDISALLERREVRETPAYSLLFDYKRRNPLNHSAKTENISTKNNYTLS